MSYQALFTVLGRPKVKGNHKPIPMHCPLRKKVNQDLRIKDIKDKCRILIVEADDRKVKAWENQIKLVASKYAPRVLLTGAVCVDIDFCFEKPKSTNNNYPITRYFGDKDKLERTVHDALTGIIYKDDSQVVDGRIRKMFCQEESIRIGIKAIEEEQESLF